MIANKLPHLLTAALLLCLVPACSSSSDDDSNNPPPVPPTVTSTTPTPNAVDVPVDTTIVANFSEEMSAGSLSGTTFFVTTGPSADPVAGTVSYSSSTAVFLPDAPLIAGDMYTATITTGAESSSTGTGLAADYVWSFETLPPIPPTVTSTSPVADAVGVPVNTNIVANFDEEMNEATLNDTTFFLTTGTPAVLVPGTVIYADSAAVFWPAEHLTANETYTATVTTGAQSSSTGAGLAADYVWSFETGNVTVPGVTVDLGTASNFAILAKAGISTVPPSSIVGDIGVSPAAATAITQFSLMLDSSGVFATSTQVTGQVFAANYTAPTPQNLTTAVSDMERAFTDAAARAPDVTELFAGSFNIPFTLVPGVYKWGTGVNVNANLILDGNATDVWIFQIAQDLVLANGITISLGGDARPENIFWQVSGLVELGTTTTIHGVVLTSTAVTVNTGGTVNGRLLAQTAVTLDQATIVEPAVP